MGVKIEDGEPMAAGNNRYGYKIADIINMFIDANGIKKKPATLKDGLQIIETFIGRPKKEKKQ